MFNEAVVHLKRIRVSPRKLNLVAQAIRGLPVDKAMNFLKFSRKRIAVDVAKALRSAIANAENNHNMDVDLLYVKEAFVGKNISLKRSSPRAKGRGNVIVKPFSNISIIVAESE